MGSRILIAEPPTDGVSPLQSAIDEARHRRSTVTSVEDIVRTIRTAPPDLVLLDDRMAPNGLGDVLGRIRNDPVGFSMPLIVVTDADATTARLDALRDGADDVISRSTPRQVLLARMRSLIRASVTSAALSQRRGAVENLGLAEPDSAFQSPGRIATVWHDPDESSAFNSDLSQSVSHTIRASAFSEALDWSTSRKAPDLFMIEAPIAHPGEALDLLSELRTSATTRHAAIVIVHDPADFETATSALDLGADGIIARGTSGEEIALRVNAQIARKRQADRLRASVDEGLRLALEDPLTGLYNRRYSEAHMAQLADDPTSRGFCVILCDLDRFKSINDSFGHPTGDKVLVHVARLLRDNVRSMDMVARYGGEEFLIFLPDPDEHAAHAAAERLREVIHDTPVDPGDGNGHIFVTASFGVAKAHTGERPGEVMARADGALLDAKAAGRDIVLFAKRVAA